MDEEEDEYMKYTIPLMLNGSYIRTNNASTISETEWQNGIIGRYESSRAKFIFYDINFETLLGDLYNKYDYFKLSLAQIHLMYRIGVASAVLYWSSDVPLYNREFRTLNFYIEGLDWVRSSHNQKTQTNKQKALLFQWGLNVVTSNNVSSYRELLNESYYENGLIFRKKKMATLTLGFGSCLKDDYLQNSDFQTAGNRFGNWCIKLNIQPVVM